jgi:hypothetical protein
MCACSGDRRGLPSRPQREVAPDPARLERAATLTGCGLGAPLPGGCTLGGFISMLAGQADNFHRVSTAHSRLGSPVAGDAPLIFDIEVGRPRSARLVE